MTLFLCHDLILTHNIKDGCHPIDKKNLERVFLSKIFPVVKKHINFPNFFAYAISKVYSNLKSYGEVKVIQGHL